MNKIYKLELNEDKEHWDIVSEINLKKDFNHNFIMKYLTKDIAESYCFMMNEAFNSGYEFGMEDGEENLKYQFQKLLGLDNV